MSADEGKRSGYENSGAGESMRRRSVEEDNAKSSGRVKEERPRSLEVSMRSEEEEGEEEGRAWPDERGV